MTSDYRELDISRSTYLTLCGGQRIECTHPIDDNVQKKLHKFNIETSRFSRQRSQRVAAY